MTLRQKSLTILRLLLPVLLVSAAVAWSDPVRAAEVASSGESIRCVVREDPSDPTILVSKCNYDTAGAPLTAGGYEAHIGTGSDAPHVPYSGSFYPNSADTYRKIWVGPMSGTPHGDIPAGSFVGEAKHTVSMLAYGANWYEIDQAALKGPWKATSVGGTSIWADCSSQTVSDCSTFDYWSGSVASMPFPTDWFPGSSDPNPAGNPCTTLTIDYTFQDGAGPENVKLTLGGVIASSGDTLRAYVTSSGDPFTGTIASRWTAADPLEARQGISEFVSVWPLDFAVPHVRSGASIDLGNFELVCQTDGFDDLLWVPGSGWLDAAANAVTPRCQDTFSFVWFRADSSGTFQPVGNLESGAVSAGHSVRLSVDVQVGKTPTFTTLDMRLDSAGSWLTVGDVGSPTVYPALFDFATADSGQLLDAELRCTTIDGVEVFGFDGVPVAGFVVTGSGVGCYAQSGMTLTNPLSWISGAGRMGVCLTEYLLIPDGDRVDALIGDASEDLEGQFPFSAGYLLLDFGQTAVDSIDTAAQCIDLDMDVGSYETPCLATDVVSAGSWRPTLVVIVIGLLLLSVIGLSFELIRK